MHLAEAYYAAAFARFANTTVENFEFRAGDKYALIRIRGVVYRVLHPCDLAKEYRGWFAAHHDLLFTELPAAIWNHFLQDTDTSSADFLIDLYVSWKAYWENQAAIYDLPKRYASAVDKAHTRFALFSEKLRAKHGRPVELAWEIDDIDLLPVVALTVRKQHRNDEDFFQTLAALMTSKYQDQLGDGKVFATVLQKVPDYVQLQAFFIYTVEENFEGIGTSDPD